MARIQIQVGDDTQSLRLLNVLFTELSTIKAS